MLAPMYAHLVCELYPADPAQTSTIDLESGQAFAIRLSWRVHARAGNAWGTRQLASHQPAQMRLGNAPLDLTAALGTDVTLARN